MHDHAQLRIDAQGGAADFRRGGTGRWLLRAPRGTSSLRTHTRLLAAYLCRVLLHMSPSPCICVSCVLMCVRRQCGAPLAALWVPVVSYLHRHARPGPRGYRSTRAHHGYRGGSSCVCHTCWTDVCIYRASIGRICKNPSFYPSLSSVLSPSPPYSPRRLLLFSSSFSFSNFFFPFRIIIIILLLFYCNFF
jgi:hypothetical protein